MNLRPVVLLTAALLLSGCGAGGVTTTSSGNNTTLDIAFSASPIDLTGIAASYAADIAYDSHERNTFDIFLPQASQPTGLIVYVHGGGFTSGDKSVIYQSERAAEIQAALAQGAAFATINYRLLDTVDADGVIKPMGDSRRALQFIRYHAERFNIDSSRIAMYGDSAGAGTSLWLAFHDDMADPVNPDPVLRQSTRIATAGAIETQASYDIYRWESDVFVDYGLTVDTMREASPILSQRLLSFYGVSDTEGLLSNEVTAYRRDVDMLGLLSVDDPDFWIRNSEQPAAFPLSATQILHHPFHARELKEQADAIGVMNVSYIPAIGVSDPSQEEVVPFLLRQIQ